MPDYFHKIKTAAELLKASGHTMALTGAGVSTESGIRDYRGEDGVWTRDPEAEQRAYKLYQEFKDDPTAYWERIAENRRTGNDFSKYEPSRGHKALAELERMGLLQAIITQNIDNLHNRAGSKNVYDYHGNHTKLRCLECGTREDISAAGIEALYEEKRLPPLCKNCGAPMKSDVVLFLEPIPRDVAVKSREEAMRSDVVLICGTSATVNPAANLPSYAKRRNGA